MDYYLDLTDKFQFVVLKDYIMYSVIIETIKKDATEEEVKNIESEDCPYDVAIKRASRDALTQTLLEAAGVDFEMTPNSVVQEAANSLLSHLIVEEGLAYHSDYKEQINRCHEAVELGEEIPEKDIIELNPQNAFEGLSILYKRLYDFEHGNEEGIAFEDNKIMLPIDIDMQAVEMMNQLFGILAETGEYNVENVSLVDDDEDDDNSGIYGPS